MTPLERKKVTLITKYVSESFTESDWYMLGQVTGRLKVITDHPRLFRSMSFGDPDYPLCVAEVLDRIFTDDSSNIDAVIDHFDVDLWYQQKDPEKFRRIFQVKTALKPDFWTDGYLRVFISHLSSNKVRMSDLKQHLATWGISAFVAHEDIEPTKEWMAEIEAGLESMEVMAAVVEPGFKESNWCAQEVGFALGRRVDVIPLRAGMDPFGLFGKYQGVQIKGRYPHDVASEIAELLLRKPKYHAKLLQSMGIAFAGLPSNQKIERIELLETWSVVTDSEIRQLLEASALSDFERSKLKNLIVRVGAFKAIETAVRAAEPDEEIPF